MKSSYTDVCVHLRDIVVTDLKKNTIHPTVYTNYYYTNTNKPLLCTITFVFALTNR